MNELMLALEAMIRRVVQEEFDNTELKDFSVGLKKYADGNPAEFAAIISQGALDQTWFDEAVKAEATTAAERVVSELPAAAAGTDIRFFNQRMFEQAVISAVVNDDNDRVRDWIDDRCDTALRNADFSCSVEVN